MTPRTPFPGLHTQRGRRAAAVFLWASFAGYVAVSAAGDGGNLAGAGAGAALLLLLGMGGLIALARALRMTRDAQQALDERERAIRDRAHFVAYRLLGWAMIAVVGYATAAVRFPALWLPTTPREVAGTLCAVAAVLGLLPLTVMAWTEPGMEPDEEDEDAPRERAPWRMPLPRRRRIAMGIIAAGAAGLAALAWTGVGPVPAEEADTVAGVATGMAVALFLLTRSAEGKA